MSANDVRRAGAYRIGYCQVSRNIGKGVPPQGSLGVLRSTVKDEFQEYSLSVLKLGIQSQLDK